MKKDRFVAFFDAVMAIVMTIVVLEFVVPNGASWTDLNVFWFQLLAYAVSFFWLGTMWVNLHSIWNHVETVSRAILFVNLFTLFFSSMIPFFTVYMGRNIGERVPQVLFGVDVMLIVLCNLISTELLAKRNAELKKRILMLRKTYVIDESIKVIGIIIGVLLFPPTVMISTFVSVVFLAIIFSIGKRKYRKSLVNNAN